MFPMGTPVAASARPDSRRTSIVLGMLALLPCAMSLIAVAYAFVGDPGFKSVKAVNAYTNTLITLAIAAALAQAVAIGVFAAHLFRSNRVKTELRPIWLVALIFAPAPASIVYWCFYVWPTLKPTQSDRLTLQAG